MDYTRFNNIIKSAKNILIVSHINPDGDTLGSMCALYQAIYKNFKKKCDMLVVSKIPTTYHFLPNIQNVKHIENVDKSMVYDLTICTDIASLDRFTDANALFEISKNTVNIDHHKTNTKYANENFINPNASSTGEFLYEIMKSLQWKIDVDTATCLYTAVLTDTGSFRFSNTSPATFKVAADLVALGVDAVEVYKNCYENNSKSMVMFQAYCISNAKFEEDDKIAYSIIHKKDIERFAAGEDCTEGLAEKLRAIETTKISFIVKEIGPKLSKVSMRSKEVDVAEICAQFGGGGHTAAAGCVIKATPQTATKKLLSEIKKRKI